MNNQQEFDVIVLGGGPGGYPAAIRAAQKGKKVALVEAKELGGTCLNRGCIPSKTLIASAEVLERIKEAEEFGVQVKDISFDFSKMAKRKDTIVEKIRKSLEGLIAANKITVFRGFGRLTSPTTLTVSGLDSVTLKGSKIILATGSEPRNIPSFPFDGQQILDSTALLNLQSLPKSLAIVGGGVIGCEFASLYSTLGIPVTILEMMPRLLPMEDESVSAALTKVFKKKGIQILTNVKVEGIEKNKQGISVKIADSPSIEAEIALVAVGRSLNTTGIGLETAGVKLTDKGLVAVNDKMETNVPGIYAVGDIASTWWLAHVATHQGLIAASNAVGEEAHIHYDAIPSVIFTSPEIGTVGMGVEAAKKRGFDPVVGAFPFQALGKSQATRQTDGFAQIVTDRSTGQILGAQVVGHEASALIAEMAVAIANELTVECLTETIHAHPTIAEAWLEAGLIASDTPLHFPPLVKKGK